MNFVIRFVLSIPAYYLIQAGLASKGYGILAQIVISVAVLVVYDIRNKEF